MIGWLLRRLRAALGRSQVDRFDPIYMTVRDVDAFVHGRRVDWDAVAARRAAGRQP